MKTSKLIMSILITLFVINYTIDDWREGGNWFSVSVLIVAVSLIVWIWMKENTSVAFYFAWVFTNIAGVIVGLVIGGFISLISMDLKSQSSQVIGVIIAIVVFSAIFGVVQWLVLRKRFENAKQWILLTMLGSIIGVTLIFFLSKPSTFVSIRPPLSMFGSIFGFSLGWAQWFHLKRQVKQAGWWIFISAVGVTAGVLVNYDCNCGIDSPLGALFLTGTYAVIYAGVYAVISEVFLAGLTAPLNLRSIDEPLNSIADNTNGQGEK